MTSILYITLRADIGGGPKHVFELSQEIKNRNNFSVYIASPIQKPFGEKFLQISAEHFEMPFRKFSLITLLRLIRFCNRHNIQIIHSHGRGAGIYSRLLKFFGFKVIHTYHGIHRDPGPMGFLKIKIDKILENLTDALIFVSFSEYKKAKSVGLGNRNAITIENGINPLLRTMSKTRGRTLGNLSRLTFQKGQDSLIDHFHALISEYPSEGFQLFLGGEGEDHQILHEKIKSLNLQDKVILKGEITDPVSFLETLDVYVSLSRWEGLPLSVLEAMFLKIPCVLSNVIGHEEFISRGAADDGTTPQMFSNSIHRLLSDGGEYERLANNGYNFVKNKHTLQRQVDENEILYRKML